VGSVAVQTTRIGKFTSQHAIVAAAVSNMYHHFFSHSSFPNFIITTSSGDNVKQLPVVYFSILLILCMSIFLRVVPFKDGHLQRALFWPEFTLQTTVGPFNATVIDSKAINNGG
jgi:hypothetical protein